MEISCLFSSLTLQKLRNLLLLGASPASPSEAVELLSEASPANLSEAVETLRAGRAGLICSRCRSTRFVGKSSFHLESLSIRCVLVIRTNSN